VLVNTVVSGNMASGSGGGIFNYTNSSPVLVNVRISGNDAANNGGGMYNDDSSPVLVNTVVSSNMVGDFYQGGGMYNDNASSPDVQNSIIWANGSYNIYNNSSTPTYTYSLVEGLNPSGAEDGGNNIDGINPSNTPKFVSVAPAVSGNPTTEGDYRLLSNSPAIERGSNDLYPNDANDATWLSTEAKAAINAALAKDLGGSPRIKGDNIDMGAYEY
jgi:hypothetical protein